jgi:hypothetical protein
VIEPTRPDWPKFRKQPPAGVSACPDVDKPYRWFAQRWVLTASDADRLDGDAANPSWMVAIPDLKAMSAQEQHDWWVALHEATLRLKDQFPGHKVPDSERRPALPDCYLTSSGGCEHCYGVWRQRWDYGETEEISDCSDAFTRVHSYFSARLRRCPRCETVWLCGYFENFDYTPIPEEWGDRTIIRQPLTAAEIAVIEQHRATGDKLNITTFGAKRPREDDQRGT